MANVSRKNKFIYSKQKISKEFLEMINELSIKVITTRNKKFRS